MGLFQCHLPVVSAKEIESVRDRYEVWSWGFDYYPTMHYNRNDYYILDWPLMWIYLGLDLLGWGPVLNTQMVLGRQLLPTISTWWFLDCAYLISIKQSKIVFKKSCLANAVPALLAQATKDHTPFRQLAPNSRPVKVRNLMGIPCTIVVGHICMLNCEYSNLVKKSFWNRAPYVITFAA